MDLRRPGWDGGLMVIIQHRTLYSVLRVFAWIYFVPYTLFGGLFLLGAMSGLADEPMYVYTWPRVLKLFVKLVIYGFPGWGGIILTTRALRREAAKEPPRGFEVIPHVPPEGR
jgi:hypothetical protein